MNRDQAKNLFKAAVVIYVASFLIINWNDVSWIFNYKEMYGLVSDFFNPYPGIDSSTMDAYFYPNHSQNSSVASAQTQGFSASNAKPIQQAEKEIKTTYTEKQNTLEIPGLSITAPIVFSNSAEKNSIMKDLDKGVVYYPGSVYPGQVGQIIILGHSAPAGWPKVKYDWIFTKIDGLKAGDKILIDLNNKQYTYIVKKTTIIARGAEVPVDNNATQKSILTLISCWPPGKDYQRIAVQAELES